MKNLLLLLLLLCCLSSYAQTKTKFDESKVRIEQSKSGWYYITQSDEDLYFYQPGRVVRDPSSSSATWIKIIPKNPSKTSKELKFKQTIAYVLRYNSAHCGEKRISVEQLVFYNSKNKIIPRKSNELNTYRIPVLPDSVGERILEILCQNKAKK
jgi:hypothetical protein